MIHLRRLFVGILFLICLGCLLSSCREHRRLNRIEYIDAPYDINHYIDTLDGHIILTTVASNSNNYITVSTLELK